MIKQNQTWVALAPSFPNFAAMIRVKPAKQNFMAFRYFTSMPPVFNFSLSKILVVD